MFAYKNKGKIVAMAWLIYFTFLYKVIKAFCVCEYIKYFANKEITIHPAITTLTLKRSAYNFVYDLKPINIYCKPRMA